MKNKVKKFSESDSDKIEKEIEDFFQEKGNIKVTAMAMAVDPSSDWIYVLITYEEGE